MSEPLQAIVDDETARVTGVIVCDQDTADMFASFDPPVFPGATLHDCTNVPGVTIGWTYDPTGTPAFAPPSDEPESPAAGG